MTKQKTRTCTACGESKPLTARHFAKYGRGHLNTCRPCYAATPEGQARQSLGVFTSPEPRVEASPAAALPGEREDALQFAIGKLMMLQDELTRSHAEVQALEARLEAKTAALAQSEESLELARMEIEELEKKLTVMQARQSVQGLTPSERAALADFGYRPAAV